MNSLYISGDFLVSELISDEAVIARYEADQKAFVEEWINKIRSRFSFRDVGRPISIHTSLSKEIEPDREV